VSALACFFLLRTQLRVSRDRSISSFDLRINCFATFADIISEFFFHVAEWLGRLTTKESRCVRSLRGEQASAQCVMNLT
jgi:hypothetical protein